MKGMGLPRAHGTEIKGCSTLRVRNALPYLFPTFASSELHCPQIPGSYRSVSTPWGTSVTSV